MSVISCRDSILESCVRETGVTVSWELGERSRCWLDSGFRMGCRSLGRELSREAWAGRARRSRNSWTSGLPRT